MKKRNDKKRKENFFKRNGETDVPMLIYEFIPNGTLSQHFHDPNEEFPLSWEMRFQIATKVAGALF
ncbi:hypothetical protein ACSBR1_040026 [Camellia fascicularis]